MLKSNELTNIVNRRIVIDSLLVFILGYVMLLGMHWLFKLEHRLVSGKIKSKIFWIPLRIANGVVVALCFALPIIMLLNGIEFLSKGDVVNGVVLSIGGILMVLCSCGIFARKLLKKGRDKKDHTEEKK